MEDRVVLVTGAAGGIGRAAAARFRGVEHRLETVATIDGVRYVNDSQGTQPDAVVAALRAFDAPTVLIAGGRDKGSDFASVARQVRDRVKAVILFGEAGPLMEKAWSPVFATQRTETLEEAVKQARQLARTGDVAVLSPMCASFDEFRNYEDRGEKFKVWIRGNYGPDPAQSLI